MTRPEGVRTIHIKNATILPGFINAHVHSRYDEKNLSVWAQAGVTTVRDLSGPYFTIDDPFAFIDSLNEDPRNARVVAAGPMVTVADGYPIVPWGGKGLEVESPEDARAKVNALLDEGADIIKIPIESGWFLPEKPKMLSPEEASAIVEVAHARHTIVSAHVMCSQDLALALDAGVDDIAHMVVDNLQTGLVQRMIAEDVFWVPTLELWNCVGGVNRRHAIENLRLFQEAGGKVALGTDFYGYDCDWQLGMPMTEMELMQEAGMTPMDIIVAGTMNAAHVCNTDGELGTVEQGRIADLIVVEGDPLEDIHNLERVALVIHNGVIIRNELEPSAGLSWFGVLLSIAVLLFLRRHFT